MLKFLIFLFTIILIFLFARRNQRFYIVRTITLLIKYILVPLLIIYYIDTNYDFFYDEDTSWYTTVDYRVNSTDTNYLSENILHGGNFPVDNSTNSNLQKHNSIDANLSKDSLINSNKTEDSLINSNKTEGSWSKSDVNGVIRTAALSVLVVSLIILVVCR